MIRSGPIGAVSFRPMIPGDKSITHRAFLMSALATGTYRVTGGNAGEDCLHTLRALQALGVSINQEAEGITLKGAGGKLQPPGKPLNLGNSGTGLRLLLGILAGQNFETTLQGDASLNRRPMNRVLEPLRIMGAQLDGDTPPVRVQGGNLRGLEYAIPVASAQVKSAILLAGVQAQGVSVLRGRIHTRDHTERMLEYFGAPSLRHEGELRLKGPVPLGAVDIQVPGDPSAAAFYLAVPGLVSGSEVVVEDMCLNPGRIGYLDCLRRMGLEVEITSGADALEPRGRVCVTGTLSAPLEITQEEVPGIIDELPILVTLCALAPGKSTLCGLQELKVKESNRLESMHEGLRRLGADIEMLSEGWVVRGTGGTPLEGGEVESRGDHRVAMALLMAGLASRSGTRVLDAAGIETSDPNFCTNLNTLEELGA